MSSVKQGQSFQDKTIELTGSVDNAFAMSKLNGRSITDPLEIGESLTSSGVTNKRILDSWTPKNLPATALTNADHLLLVPDDGIGAMIIGETLIVR